MLGQKTGARSVIERAAERLQRAPDAVAAPVARTPAAVAAEPLPPLQQSPPAALPPRATSGVPAKLLRRSAGRVEIDLKRLPKVGVVSPAYTSNRTTEEFRMIKHAALQRVARASEAGFANARLIMVTSAREGEGKSFVASNLALSIAAEKDRSVLLVDADPSRSAVARYFDISAERGLLDALEHQDIGFADVVLETNIDGLYLIPAGPRRPLSAELYASDRMGKLLDQIVRELPNSIILFDAPPVLATGEPSALAQRMGQIVFVVEAEKTAQSAIAEALNLINICPNIGFVFNKMRFQFGSVRFGYYYGYYNRK